MDPSTTQGAHARQTGGPSIIPAIEPPARTLKEIYTSSVKLRYPSFTPQNAFQIMSLLGCPLPQGTPDEELEAWLAERLRQDVSMHGSVEAVMQLAQNTLDVPTLVTTTGAKPPVTAGKEQGVFFLPVTNDSRVAIRIFPGPLDMKQYCLDFVDGATHEPLDAPFDDYELWATGSLSAHSWTRLATLEDSAGVPREGRLPGQQKFVLQDGLHCRLRGTEHKPMDVAMDFWIPVRQGRQEERPAIPGARLCQFDI